MTGFPRRAAMLLLLVAVAGSAVAQQFPAGFDETFAVSSLDPDLSRGADAVVRLDLLRFEVQDPGRATRTVRRAVTVLNADGRDKAELYVFYDDRLRHLTRLTGRIFDAEGRIVRKLEKEDQEDYSAISGSSLYEDERVRVARLHHHAFPYTVEFEYQIRHDGLIRWPTWYPQEEGMPVVFGRFELTTGMDVEARYHVQGASLDPEVSHQGSRTTLRWEIVGEPALTIEPLGPAWQDQVIAVHTAPTTFEIEGTRGDMRSWQSFGRWYHRLNDGRAVLPAAAQQAVILHTASASSVREKAERLYTYMQDRTRYVSVQLGLGGWQAFDAAYVHERRYGDCKALTNYLRALLSEAGIASFPALIRAGSRAPRILPDFPSNQFNHVILYVDLGDGDGVWLESTDPTAPFGHLGSFTEDRYALLVKPGGGELVRTPQSQADRNQRVLQARVRLTSSGDATAELRLRHTGNEQDEIRQRIATQSGHQRERWLYDFIDVPSFEIVEADFTGAEKRFLAGALSVRLTLPRYAALTGRRLFVPINLLHRWTYVPPASESRTQTIEFFPYAFAHADTIRYELPEGFTIEALPNPVEIETPFLRYTAWVDVPEEGVLVYTRRATVTDNSIPPELYHAFRDSMSRIAQADRAQAVLVAR
jgi:hypothetical protein